MCNSEQGYYQALHSLRCTKCNKYYPDKCECGVVRIYRVEDPDGVGMYYSDLSPWDLTIKMQTDELHPAPKDDSSISRWWDNNFNTKSRLFFGFASLEQLKMWIHSDNIRHKLNDLGLTISVYELTANLDTCNPDTDYILGDTQAIFDKSFFTKVATLKLTEV